MAEIGIVAAGDVMAALERLKTLRTGVAPEVPIELVGLMTSDRQAGAGKSDGALENSKCCALISRDCACSEATSFTRWNS